MSLVLRCWGGDSSWAEPHESSVCGSWRPRKNTVTAKLWPQRESWSGGIKHGVTSLSASHWQNPVQVIQSAEAKLLGTEPDWEESESGGNRWNIPFKLKMWSDYSETENTMKLDWKCDSVKLYYWLPITQRWWRTEHKWTVKVGAKH